MKTDRLPKPVDRYHSGLDLFVKDIARMRNDRGDAAANVAPIDQRRMPNHYAIDISEAVSCTGSHPPDPYPVLLQ